MEAMHSEIGRLEVDGRSVPIVLDAAAGRVEADAGGHVAFIALRRHGTELAAVHTEVPAALRGKRVGDALAAALLDHARREHLLVQPYCPFVAAFIGRHPEYADLVDPNFQ